MASSLRLEMHPEGFNQARTEPAVQAAVTAMAQRIADAASNDPDDFVVHESPSSTRARTVVVTATIAAMRAEAEERVLSKSLDAGRG